jgi:uncharacterized FlgJ-related protein
MLSTLFFRYDEDLYERIVNVYLNEPKFSEERLIAKLKQLNVRYPHIALAQARIESGNYRSTIFLENNNMFGMKCARRRPTTHQGELHGHAYFQTWEDCVLDYAFFQTTYMKHITSKKEYFQYLADNYAEDPEYTDKLKIIIHNNN